MPPSTFVAVLCAVTFFFFHYQKRKSFSSWNGRMTAELRKIYLELFKDLHDTETVGSIVSTTIRRLDHASLSAELDALRLLSHTYKAAEMLVFGTDAKEERAFRRAFLNEWIALQDGCFRVRANEDFPKMARSVANAVDFWAESDGAFLPRQEAPDWPRRLKTPPVCAQLTQKVQNWAQRRAREREARQYTERISLESTPGFFLVRAPSAWRAERTADRTRFKVSDGRGVSIVPLGSLAPSLCAHVRRTTSGSGARGGA